MSTLISSLSTLSFPPRNENVHARWMPVYIEPMIGSGERICIAVATANDSGFLVVPVVALDRLECLYGKEADAILFAADFVTNDLRNALAKEGASELENWKPPMEGAYSGRIANGSGSSLEEIARTGLTMCASLVERLSDADDEVNSNTSKISGNRLEQLVKEKVLFVRPELEQMFGRQRKLGENVRSVTIGFVGNTIAANFGVLMPQYLSGNVKDIKAKLWDIAQLREDFGQPQLIVSTISRFEMFIFKPANDAPEYSDRQLISINEAVNELEAEADKKDIKCRPCVTRDAIADIILEAEAA
jgi:hypothetical protein